MTQLKRLSSVLSDGHWHSTGELVQEVGHRFSATMHIATKKHGYQIEKRRGSDRQYEYRAIAVTKRSS
ncbi:MAG: hypothetical protein KME12_17080 [Trichocoleus desertorum ATA4-8-CV12]|jgi:hypothetical protein|nr:hypothetical protein [Trichocoleus desertorum ATA4-8-CV12]